jgi:hypothetical protein
VSTRHSPERPTPLKAIRANCIICAGGSSHEVKLCTIPTCPLYPFRFGRNPSRAGIGGNPQLTARLTNPEAEDV